MFRKLVTEASQRLNIPVTTVTAVLSGLGALMTNDRTGGINGFVDSFRRAGIGEVITSWFAGKQGKPVTASHVETVLGAGAIQRLAEQAGITRAVASSAVAFLLPKVMSLLTPNGTLPTNEAVVLAFSEVTSQAGSQLPRDMEARPRPPWVPWAAAGALALVGIVWARNREPTIDRARLAADSVRIEREAAGSVVPQAGMPELLGVTWQWQTASTAAEQRTIDSPERYTVRFEQDGRIVLRADCNRGAGSYTAAADGQLTIGAVALTRAMCPEGSLSNRFAADVGKAMRFEVREGALVLTLPYGGGALRFRKAP